MELKDDASMVHNRSMKKQRSSVKKQQSSVIADHNRRMVDEHEAARMLAMSVAMLRKWRWLKEGPRYRKIGRRVVYQIADIDAFIASLPAGDSVR